MSQLFEGSKGHSYSCKAKNHPCQNKSFFGLKPGERVQLFPPPGAAHISGVNWTISPRAFPTWYYSQSFPKEAQICKTKDIHVALWISMRGPLFSGNSAQTSPSGLLLLDHSICTNAQLRVTHISSAAHGCSPSTLPFHSPMKWGTCNSTQENRRTLLVWHAIESRPASNICSENS